MNDNKIKKILRSELDLIKPPKEIYDKIVEKSETFITELKEKLSVKGIKAEVFIGGSLAKGTLVKKDVYDIDVFVRFDKEYKDDEISNILGGVCKEGLRVHGSRDYYQIMDNEIVIEVIPVKKIDYPDEAVNVTDLSFFHVRYLLDKINKNPNLIDEIRLAKIFTYAQNVYGAESYINGFSGYALELLISHYESFLKFIKAVVKENRIIIDDAGFYSGNEDVLKEMNDSKISGPVILIDPTFKNRNACSSLSYEIFSKFKEVCKKFLEKPSMKFFEVSEISDVFSRFKNLKVVEVKTSKQAGDIAGTKSKKFFGFFVYSLKKEFEIKKSGFSYDDEKNVAKFYFVLGVKKDEIVKGPPVTASDNLDRFEKVHKDSFVKEGFVYVKVKHNLNFEEWFKKFKKNEDKRIKEMDVVYLK